MKFALVTLALMVACASAASIFDGSLDQYWMQYKKQHSKFYTSVEEETTRRLTWESNLRYIQQHNIEADLGKHTYWLKMNKYGDMTNQEFVRTLNGFNMTRAMKSAVNRPTFLKPSNVKIPDSVDWRTQGYVTPVKDQGQCGSCWAFSAVASLEGQHFKQSGKLVSLSEQNLVDCSGNFGNMGCDGGLMDQAFQYIQANKGIDTEQSYPYEAVDNNCRFNAANVGATDNGFTDITSGSEDDLAAAIATVGPISVAIDASQSSFQFYSTGIYSDPSCSSTELDHGVTAVGYGSLGQGQDFYIVKNSWSTSWGDQGYIKMARNQNNMCGIATAASYPLV
jgi:cathepsin L